MEDLDEVILRGVIANANCQWHNDVVPSFIKALSVAACMEYLCLIGFAMHTVHLQSTNVAWLSVWGPGLPWDNEGGQNS